MNRLQTYITRLLESRLDQALKVSPVVVLTGARQTGKSTLVRHSRVGSGREYLTLDDIDIQELSASQPDALVDRAPLLTIDEVQRAPGLLRAVKRAVDRDRVNGRFVLTGSANLLLMKHVNETLAGRAVYMNLLPMTRAELDHHGSCGLWPELFSARPKEWLDLIKSSGKARTRWQSVALQGGYPVPAIQLRKKEDRSLWFDGYVRTYLERDLRDITNVASVVDFRRLMRAVCLRIGQLLNQSELARDVGISQPTVHRHLDALETSYQLVRLPAYFVNRTKRLIKSPKAYWSDTGLAMHIAGETEPGGSHLENVILSDLLAWKGAGDGIDLHYWRTSAGEEVDFVIEWKGRLLPIEVKATSKPRLSDARHLFTFQQEYKRKSLAALLLHAGTEIYWMADGILAAPWWLVL